MGYSTQTRQESQRNMLSSKDKETDRVWGMRQRAREYLTKPFKAEELLAKICASEAPEATLA